MSPLFMVCFILFDSCLSFTADTNDENPRMKREVSGMEKKSKPAAAKMVQFRVTVVELGGKVFQVLRVSVFDLQNLGFGVRIQLCFQ